jgi:hypothetical protein
MIQHLLKEIGGIGLYGVISVCFFFLIFGVTLAWAFALKKPFLKSMESLPLQDEKPCVRKGETRHE